MSDAVFETDGRTARRDRNRQAVIDAYSELTVNGVVDPAFDQIAEHAGVSFRSVYRYFDNLEDLKDAATEQAMNWLNPLTRKSTGASAPTDPVTHRVDTLVASRLAFFEEVADTARFAYATRRSNDAFAAHIEVSRKFLREQIAEIFAPELAALADDTAELRISAIAQIVSFMAIDYLDTAAEHTSEELHRSLRVQILAVITAPSLEP